MGVLGILWLLLLWITVTFASFHSSGRVPDLILVLKIIAKGTHITEANSFRTLGWIPSGPLLLCTFNFSSFFFTISSLISIINLHSVLSGMTLSYNASSFVNTDTKYWFNIFAFSMSELVVTLLPVGVSSSTKRSGIFGLALVLLFTNCQNFFGLVFACFATFFSNTFCAFLVMRRTWLLTLRYSRYTCPSFVWQYFSQWLTCFLVKAGWGFLSSGRYLHTSELVVVYTSFTLSVPLSICRWHNFWSTSSVCFGI